MMNATAVSLLQLTGGMSLPALQGLHDELTVVGGYTHVGTPHEFRPLPSIPLETIDPLQIVELLAYAGVHYTAAESPAAEFGVKTFSKGREFALKSGFEMVTFDWDHTVSNYKIFESIPSLIWLKIRKEKAGEKTLKAPLTAIEAPLLYMQELVLGMMVGFALKQGLTNFDQWERYRPQVGLATHTWPDRLGILGSYSIRLLPLMEGLIPGDPATYNRITSRDSRAFMTLHDFLDHATALMTELDRAGTGGFLSERDSAEALSYLEAGHAHKTKPWGAFDKKWGAPNRSSRILHVDDSPQVLHDLLHVHPRPLSAVILVQSPWNGPDTEISETQKLEWSALWRSRDDAIASTVAALTHAAAAGSAVPNILGAFDLIASGHIAAAAPYAAVPLEGAVLAVHEAGTTLGEFLEYYERPKNAAKALIRKVRFSDIGRAD